MYNVGIAFTTNLVILMCTENILEKGENVITSVIPLQNWWQIKEKAMEYFAQVKQMII